MPEQEMNQKMKRTANRSPLGETESTPCKRALETANALNCLRLRSVYLGEFHVSHMENGAAHCTTIRSPSNGMPGVDSCEMTCNRVRVFISGSTDRVKRRLPSSTSIGRHARENAVSGCVFAPILACATIS